LTGTFSYDTILEHSGGDGLMRGTISILSGINLLALVLLLIIPPLSYSQNNRIQFQHVTAEQGLSHPCVTAICQDSSGFMWFGAFRGLNRFDGREIKYIDISTIANALCTAPNGDIWIGHGGVNRVSIAGDTIERYKLNGARAIVCDGDSAVWVGNDDGFFRINPKDGRITRMGHEALADSGVNSMAMDKQGNIWLVTRSSILCFNKATLRSRAISPRHVHTHSGIAVAPDGTVWIAGGPSGQLCKIDPVIFQLTDILENGAQVMANDVAVDHSGLVYIGTQRYGLKLYDPMTKKWATYKHAASDPQSLADDEVRCVVFDRNGNLWVGTSSGVSWAARWRKSFTIIPAHSVDEVVSPKEVRDIVEDDEGNLWLGTAGGLRKWDRQKGTVTSFKNASERITSLEIIHQHQLWIGMIGKKNLMYLDTHLRNKQPQAMSLSGINDDVTAMYRDGDTILWLGCTRSRLHRYDLRTGRSVTYTYDTPDPKRIAFTGDDCPRMIYRDRQGALWIATVSGVLNRNEHSGFFKRYLAPNGGNYWFRRNTWCVYEDTKGLFWVGNDQGLDLFNRSKGTFDSIIQSSRRWQGKTVVGILEDRTGALWLQTDGKLLRYRHDTGELREFGPNNGFPITYLGTFATLGNRARCITHAGEFVFGVRNAIVLFRPEDLREDPEKPNVTITGVEVFGQPVPDSVKLIRTFTLPEQPLRLDAGHNALEFRFAGLDYAMPNQIQYAVWLEPADHNWSNLGTQNTVRFMNLSPGSYRLRVRAANGDSIWSSREASYRFGILPPWWMTWWFRTLAFLVCIGIIVTIVQLRMRHMLAQERLRLQIASDLHDDIGSSLSSIALVSENVRSELGEDHPAQHSLRSMTSVAREAADKLKDDVWVIKPGSDTLENLFLRMKDVTQSSIGHMEYSFQNGMDGISRQVPMAFRRNILLIYKEALNNVLKHSSATNVEILIGFDDGTMTLDVRDNGKGFDPKVRHKGNGLINLQRRADALKGDLLIDSAKNEGTHIHFKVKIP
jgi:signal transduction histidine kinase/ligand-binding sensor domain-containing protein